MWLTSGKWRVQISIKVWTKPVELGAWQVAKFPLTDVLDVGPEKAASFAVFDVTTQLFRNSVE